MKILLVSALLAATAAGQTTFVLPTKLASKAGDTAVDRLFWTRNDLLPVRCQLVYDVADVPVPTGIFKGLAFRRSYANTTTNTATTATVDISLSVGPNDRNTVSLEFAKNLGTSVVKVFSGNLNLPVAQPGTGVPPFVVNIPFTQVFPYVGAQGMGFVIDYTITAYGPAGSWYLDALGMDGGKVGVNWNPQATNGCKWNSGKYPDRSRDNVTPCFVGMAPWWVQYNNGPPNLPGISVLGTKGAGAQWFSLLLPINLVPYGGVADCHLANDMVFGLGVIMDAQGLAKLSVPIPNDPSLAGAIFYDQGLFLDQNGLVACISSKWTIGAGVKPPGAWIYRYSDSPPWSTASLKWESAIAVQITL